MGTIANLRISLLQWHVSERALQQWAKYKAMLEADAAKHEQPVPATDVQGNARKPSAEVAVHDALPHTMLAIHESSFLF